MKCASQVPVPPMAIAERVSQRARLAPVDALERLASTRPSRQPRKERPNARAGLIQPYAKCCISFTARFTARIQSSPLGLMSHKVSVFAHTWQGYPYG